MVLMQRSPKEEADRLQWQLGRLLKLRIMNNFTIKGLGLLENGRIGLGLTHRTGRVGTSGKSRKNLAHLMCLFHE
jgi:hypothetical protein